jgi:hypothetical protein
MASGQIYAGTGPEPPELVRGRASGQRYGSPCATLNLKYLTAILIGDDNGQQEHDLSVV